MGMSTYVVGLKLPDETWEKMKKVWDACIEAGLKVPVEVAEYFQGNDPDAAFIKIDLNNICSEYIGEYEGGFEFDIKKIPSGVTKIRVLNRC